MKGRLAGLLGMTCRTGLDACHDGDRARRPEGDPLTGAHHYTRIGPRLIRLHANRYLRGGCPPPAAPVLATEPDVPVEKQNRRESGPARYRRAMSFALYVAHSRRVVEHYAVRIPVPHFPLDHAPVAQDERMTLEVRWIVGCGELSDSSPSRGSPSL